MAQIKFKATRRLHSSGWRQLEKSGNLEYDFDKNSTDGVWITTTQPTRIIIDCDKQGNYYLKFDENSVERQDYDPTI